MSKRIAIHQYLSGKDIVVTFLEGDKKIAKHFDAVTLGCQWFSMTNDQFYKRYGFNLNPHEWKIQTVSGQHVSLYEHCRKMLYGA